MDKLYVVAGNMDEFRQFVNRKKAEHDKANEIMPRYIFVHSTDTLRGLSKVHGWFTGTYQRRSDIEQIKECIKIINAIRWPSLYDTYTQNIDSYKNISDMFRDIEAHNNMVFEAMYNNSSN